MNGKIRGKISGKIMPRIMLHYKLLPYRGRYQDELPETLRVRKYLKHSELVKLMTWKLTVSGTVAGSVAFLSSDID